MPVIPFDTLPDDARVWVFGSDRPLTGADAERLLDEVDDFLARWTAHGAPLRCARRWDEDRFLTIGVDQRDAGASGCSIDGLFRSLQRLQQEIGAQLLGGGRIFYRDAAGATHCIPRDELARSASAAEVTRDTPVFDIGVTTLSDWRTRFERPAAESWLAALL